MASSTDTPTDQAHPRAHRSCRGRRCRGGNWSVLNIATMVAGFVLFWPLGLFILFWIVLGRDVGELPDMIRRLWSSVSGTWHDHDSAGVRGPTDNVVFNEFQQAQYERIREIKDEIKGRTRRFRQFRANARRRADKEEFDRFMADAPLRDEC